VRPEHSETLDVDIVISATGVRPNIGFLSGSGVAAQTGILVDDAVRASVENVYAAGDRRQPRPRDSDRNAPWDMLGISHMAEVGRMSQAVVGRWGKNLAIRFPADVAKSAGLDEGQRVEIVSHDDQVVIRKLPPEFAVEEMFRGKSPQAWRELYADAYDWGPDRGRERVEE
jgi:antitoxin component of MazEF toxin-antitoxin module